MVHTSPELQLPDEFATPEEIALWQHELVPGVNVPRKGVSNFHLTPGTAAFRLWDVLSGRLKESSNTLTEESDDEALSR